MSSPAGPASSAPPPVRPEWPGMGPRYLGSGPSDHWGSDSKPSHQPPADAQPVGAAFQTREGGGGAWLAAQFPG